MELNDLDGAVGEPVVLHGRISPDYLPEPEACLITGLTPRITSEGGLVEADLARRIEAVMTAPGTCAAGFNTLRFDDEFVRNLFYRTFRDPYAREYRDGNSRWDIIDLVRMAHDLRPEGITWVADDDGRPVFRLERLTAANGLVHESAHDALSDVEATIALARLVRDAQPKLFEWYLGMRDKRRARRMLTLQSPEPIIYTAPEFTRPGGCTSVVIPVSRHPEVDNQTVVFDLRQDPAILWDLSPEELRNRLFAHRDQLGDVERPGLTTVRANRVPAIAPLSTLTEERAAALGIDLEAVHARVAVIVRAQEERNLAARLQSVYQRDGYDMRADYRDPDLNLYSGGFFGDQDRRAFERLREATPHELAALLREPPPFEDVRAPEMLRRFVARNYPDVLDEAQQQRWRSFCSGRLLAPERDDAYDLIRFKKAIQSRMTRVDVSPRDKVILKDLADYARWLESNVVV